MSITSKVIIKKADYDYELLKPIVFEMLDTIASGRISRNVRVLIKPNLLSPARPDSGITTHPVLVRLVAEYALDHGAAVQISDSPAVGSFHKILKRGGYKEALADLAVNVKPFRESIKVDIGEPFGTIELAKDALEADLVINLAKLKTHAQMLLTLGVKNLFGCVVGVRKPQWHLRAGVDRQMFASLLVRICQKVSPLVTIVDGILAMEGQGPGKSGLPRELGLLIGGDNAFAVDTAICSLLGLKSEDLLTCDQARKLGVFDGQAHINGDFTIINDFKFPELGELSFGPPSLNQFFRRHLIQRPVADNKICTLCGKCWNYCPAKAITYNIKGIRFNYTDCIRCYCCIEICPHGAILAKKPFIGKVLRWFAEKKNKERGRNNFHR